MSAPYTPNSEALHCIALDRKVSLDQVMREDFLANSPRELQPRELREALDAEAKSRELLAEAESRRNQAMLIYESWQRLLTRRADVRTRIERATLYIGQLDEAIRSEESQLADQGFGDPTGHFDLRRIVAYAQDVVAQKWALGFLKAELPKRQKELDALEKEVADFAAEHQIGNAQ